ncbi:hypothetical protein Tco_0170226 [Tanacetum coccineum]
MGGSFHTSPPRSTQAPPAGTTSDGAEALDKLTALSSLVSTLVQKLAFSSCLAAAASALYWWFSLKLDFPHSSSIPTKIGTTHESPSSPVRDSKKGKGVAVDEPTSTQDKTFKQIEEERLGWEAAQ